MPDSHSDCTLDCNFDDPLQQFELVIKVLIAPIIARNNSWRLSASWHKKSQGFRPLFGQGNQTVSS